MISRARAGIAALVCATTALAGCSTLTTRDDGRAAVGAAAAPTCAIPARFKGQDVDRLPVTTKLVALTFDAGANGDAVPSIIATLQAKGVPATFFLTGAFVQKFPKKSARIGRLYLVGNHTMTHPDLTTMGNPAVRRQIRQAETVIREGTGQDPRRFFRFPFGARDQRTIGVANYWCYVPFRWTVDSLGWKGTSGGMTTRKVADRVVAAARPGEIVLMHVGSNPDDGTMLDAKALPSVIDRLRAKGYSFVRLSRVMSSAP
jgi:peptidoglycan/xylan/chitin deacetylase (PgdA/CDA1 family)